MNIHSSIIVQPTQSETQTRTVLIVTIEARMEQKTDIGRVCSGLDVAPN